MTHILHLDVSPRGDRSISRSLTQSFVTDWKAAHPDSTVTYRDIGHHPVPFVSEDWIAAAFTPPEQHTPEQAAAIRLSNELIDEFLAADLYVFGMPMYNFGVPASFKAYIDQIVRAGRTFKVDENGYQGLVHGKKAVFALSQGGSFPPGTPAEAYDLQTPYLKQIFGFMGITDLEFVYADNLAAKGEEREQSIATAQAALRAIATR
ncbi:MAG: FMN-dependent NADH-azoreductase [Synechococcales bacterium]|nr:FMN-dependent NADH-azoreductase [Synechococcales bacterium]